MYSAAAAAPAPKLPIPPPPTLNRQQATFGSSVPTTPHTSAATATPVDNAEFDTIVRTFIAKNNPKLYILTPCYGSMCHVDYISCMMQTIELFRSLNFPIQVEFCKNDSLVTRARNNLAARAMADPSCTHIMFIDSDISWTPVDVLKLVLCEKELCGGIYPLKHYNWNKLVSDPKNPYNSNAVQTFIDKKNASQLKTFITDEQMVQYNMVRYNVNYLSNYLTIENNLSEVRHLATGFMMIRRCVFEKMFRAFPSTKYVDDVCFLKEHENPFAYALFDTGCEDGHFFSEDWLFCSRWCKMSKNHKIYADVSINLSHSGVEVYSGSYIASII
jgi:hypothetical protein